MSLLSSSSSLSLLLWREGVEARSQLTDGWEEQLNRSRVFEEKKKSKTPKKRERNRRERTKKKTKKKKKKKSLFFRFQVLDFFLSFFLSFFSLSTPLSRWRSTPPRHVRSSSLLFFSFSLSLSLSLFLLLLLSSFEEKSMRLSRSSGKKKKSWTRAQGIEGGKRAVFVFVATKRFTFLMALRFLERQARKISSVNVTTNTFLISPSRDSNTLKGKDTHRTDLQAPKRLSCQQPQSYSQTPFVFFSCVFVFKLARGVGVWLLSPASWFGEGNRS